MKIRALAFQYLQEKQDRHSKVREIHYGKFEKQKYMSSHKFSQKDIELLFKLRTNMIDVKMNFKGMHVNYSCNICNKDDPQTQVHLTQCEKIIEECTMLFNNIDIEYEDIYGPPNKQIKITKLYRKILETRSRILDEIDQTK